MGHSSSGNKEICFKTVTGDSFKWRLINFTSLLKDYTTFISPTYLMNLYDHLFKINMSLTKVSNRKKNTLKLLFTLTHDSTRETTLEFIFSLVKTANQQIKILHLTTDTKQVFKTTIKDFIDIEFVMSNDLLRLDVLEILCEIQVENHNKEVQNYYKYFENQKFSDLTILHPSGQSICAHKLALISHSPIFGTMFKRRIKHHEIIKINDLEFDCLTEMIRFIYMGEVNNVESYTPNLLAAAEKYEITDLKKLCEDHILKNLNKDSAVEILIQVDENGSTDLKSKLLEYISENLEDVVNNNSFKSIKNKNLLLDVISVSALKKVT